MSEHIISMVVVDQTGMLSRITSIFKRKMLDIKSLTIVREHEDNKPRITILAEGNEKDADLACKFLANNVDVLEIELYSPNNIIQRELVLIQADITDDTDKILENLNKDFKYRILRKSDTDLVFEFIGSTLEVSLFIEQASALATRRLSRTGIMTVSN